MRLQEIMSTGVITVGPETSAEAAWTDMWRHRIRHLVVMDGARAIGLLSERDLGGRDGAVLRKGKQVRELMTAQVVSARPDTTLRQAANLMRGQSIGALPVIEGDRVVGIVTATDVLDELGRGSTRPAVQARRRSMRLPPAGTRGAAAAIRHTGAAVRRRKEQR